MRPHAPALVAEAIAALPEGVGRARLRADSGLFSGEVAHAAVDAGADFAIAAAPNPAVRAAIGSIPKTAWRKAKGMPGAQVAAIDYAPRGWPPGTRMIVRRMRVKTADISPDQRARRRRTFDPAQLALALGGQTGHAYAYSPIVTNLTGPAVALEAWFRDRAWVEERIKDSKLGMALRHLPSGYAAANEVWTWAAYLALTLSAALQALTNHDQRTARTANGCAANSSPSPPASSTTPADSSCAWRPARPTGRCSPRTTRSTRSPVPPTDRSPAPNAHRHDPPRPKAAHTPPPTPTASPITANNVRFVLVTPAKQPGAAQPESDNRPPPSK